MKTTIFAAMKMFLFLILISVSFSLRAQDVAVIHFEQLENRIANSGDTILLINFWATWCHPCVEEIPDFEKFSTQYKQYNNKPVKLLFVSLDYADKLKSKVIPFMKEKQLLSEVVLLDDTDYNSWLPKINGSWEGVIPATLFIYKPSDIYLFYVQQLTFNQLEKLLTSQLN